MTPENASLLKNSSLLDNASLQVLANYCAAAAESMG